jgi:hypothetical protein
LSEFSDSITEGFMELFTTAGDIWIQEASDTAFKAVEMNEDGSYSLIEGATDYKDEIRLSCLKSDFPAGVPRKEAIVYRQSQPKIRYKVTEDGQGKNPVNPTFFMKLELKK